MSAYLGFEKPIEALDRQASQAREAGDGRAAQLFAERARRQLAHIYANLTPIERTQVARHSARPRLGRYLSNIATEFTPLAGDRAFGDDAAILGGPASIDGQAVMLIGHARGETTATQIAHNFGMARPEGYRKAVRLMQLADRLRLPIVAFVDTPGAFPGIDAEARGQAEAIARATQCCLDLKVPLIAVIIGEGGSGGAIAIAAANRVLMMEHAVYSVISPEGCAAILWRSGRRAAEAAAAMRLTAADLLRLDIIDRIVFEPEGGAHRDPAGAVRRVRIAIREELRALAPLPPDRLRQARRERFLRFGALQDGAAGTQSPVTANRARP